MEKMEWNPKKTGGVMSVNYTFAIRDMIYTTFY